MRSFVLSLTERSLRTLPFIPLLLQSLLWKWKIGPNAWACGEEPGGRASTSDLSGLNKASLYPPQRSPHPNYTPDTVYPPPSPLPPHRPSTSTIQPCSDHDSPSVLEAPEGRAAEVLLVAPASESIFTPSFQTFYSSLLTGMYIRAEFSFPVKT